MNAIEFIKSLITATKNDKIKWHASTRDAGKYAYSATVDINNDVPSYTLVVDKFFAENAASEISASYVLAIFQSDRLVLEYVFPKTDVEMHQITNELHTLVGVKIDKINCERLKPILDEIINSLK